MSHLLYSSICNCGAEELVYKGKLVRYSVLRLDCIDAPVTFIEAKISTMIRISGCVVTFYFFTPFLPF